MGLPVWPVDGVPVRGPGKLLMLLYQNLFELIVLNLFYLLCCAPIVTIPFAASALVKVLLDMCRGQGSHPLRSYWRCFFRFGRTVFAVAGFLTAMEVLLLWGLLIYLGAGAANPLFWLGCGVNAAALMLVILVKFYALPLLHTSREGARRILLRAFCLALGRLPYSLAAFAAAVAMWTVCLRNWQSAWIAIVLLLFSLTYLVGTFCAAPCMEDAAEDKDGKGGA